MGKTMKQWEQEINTLDEMQLHDFYRALQVLSQWKFFAEAYDWTGFGTIQAMIQTRQESKEVARWQNEN